MPDADITVLLKVMPRSGGEIDGFDVWPGYWNGERWLWADGLRVAGQVEAWADMPEGPKC
jgi:hypothetical protein